MIQFETAFIAVLVVYFAIVMWEGILSFRRTKDEADFLLAGRRVGPWIGGASLAATQMSAGTFVGTIAVHYLTGASFIWAWSGIWIGYVVAALWVAPKLRKYAAEQGALTFPDFIGDRFNSNWARAVVSLLMVAAFIVYISAQYQAGGVILQTVFGMPFAVGALILMVFIVLYTVIGGLIAVIRTDFLQQTAMALGALVGIPLVVTYSGGLGSLGETLLEVSPNFLGFSFGAKDLLGFALAFGLTWAVAPHILIRFIAMPDNKTIRKSVAVALFFNILISVSVAIVGMSMKALYPNLQLADAASTVYASQLLPPVVGAIVLTAVIAAVMSTVDSVLMVAGPALSHDIYFRIFRPGASQRSRMAVNRGATLVVGAVPVLLTLRQLDIVQFMVIAFSALLGATVFVPVFLGLYWRRATATGAIWSMISGFAVVAIWYLLGEPVVHPVIPGVVASGVVMYVLSLVTQPVPERNLGMFFGRVPAEGS